MAVAHHCPDAGEIVGGQESLDLPHALALGDDVAGPPAEYGSVSTLRSRLRRAQRPAEVVGGAARIRTGAVHRGSRRAPGGFAVHDHEGGPCGDGHLVAFEAGEVDAEGVAGPRPTMANGSSRPTWDPAADSAFWLSWARDGGSSGRPSASSRAIEKAALEERPAPTGSVLVTRMWPPLGGGRPGRGGRPPVRRPVRPGRCHPDRSPSRPGY